MNYNELLKILACPKCHGELESTSSELPGFVCRHCQLVYPIKDDIPVMLIEQAVPLSQWNCEE